MRGKRQRHQYTPAFRRQGALMEVGAHGGARSKSGRKTKRRSSKKRPSSALSQLSTHSASGTPAGFAPDRYHATSFPLISDLSSPQQVTQDDESSRMSWRSLEEEKDGVSRFLFLQLPVICQLKIFAYLTNVEKARVMSVCKYWRQMLWDVGMWDRVSFSELPQACLRKSDHPFSDACYLCYKVRVFQFAEYLEKRLPVLHFLEFKFDILDNQDNYLRMIKRLLSRCACRDLRVAHLNWKDTPSKPLWMMEDNMTVCAEYMERHRHRQRQFVGFFEYFTSLAPRLSTLVLPFDWSDSSICNLARLKCLRNLVVEKYSVFQHLPQPTLDNFLVSMPYLQKLLLEVWTPSGHGLVLYAMTHKSLQYLDVSQSRGFYLQALNMPSLTRFRVARHPWNGPLVLKESVNIVCLHDVLSSGAPKLTKINDHYLESDWHHNPSERLEEVLKEVCSCRRHKKGWAM